MRQRTSSTGPVVLHRLAQLMGTEVHNQRLLIPESFGKGYCAGYVFNENIRMLILNYELKEGMQIENPEPLLSKKMLLFKVQNVTPRLKSASVDKALERAPSVLIATSRVNTNAIIPIHLYNSSISIEIDVDYLTGLIGSPEQSPVLQKLLSNTQSLLFEEPFFASLQPIVNQLFNHSSDHALELFFLRVKAEELICCLLMALVRRNDSQFYTLENRDIQIIYQLKEQMLERLDIPPTISDLALQASMSPTKLKRLFKQIFGTSIFSYYQRFRIQEAARQLSTGNRSVSEVGHQLGFTNLSHFSRIFEEHLGIKPKKYSSSFVL